MKFFSKRKNIDANKALIDHSHHTIFLFLWVKLVQVGYTRNVSFESITNLYRKRFGFFPFKNSPDVAWHIFRKTINWKGFVWNDFSVSLMSCSSSFDSFIKLFLGEFFFSNILCLAKLRLKKVTTPSDGNFAWFYFFILELSFYVQL